LPVKGKMPPTRRALALVCPEEHLAVVNSLVGALGSEAEGLLPAESLPSPESSPQAARVRPSTAVPAISRLHMAVLDRFTG
jgi:hypothetical protein